MYCFIHFICFSKVYILSEIAKQKVVTIPWVQTVGNKTDIMEGT